VFDERVQQGVGAAVAAVLAAVGPEGGCSRIVYVLTGQEIRHANREADDFPALRLELLRLLGDRHDGTGPGTAHPFREMQHHFT